MTTQPPASSVSDRRDQSLALKVMRLCKPRFHMEVIPYYGGEAEDIAPAPRCETLGLDSTLVLPQRFGNIYLGETFSGYISVYNGSSHTTTNVSIKIDVQTPQTKVTLLDGTSSPISTFLPGQSSDTIVRYELRELGAHILICSVSYIEPDCESRQFRKFFKFQVAEPVTIQTKTNYHTDHLFLEAQIENVTPTPLFLCDVRFDAVPSFSLLNLSPTQKSSSMHPTSVASGEEYSLLKPGTVRQFLYQLTPRPLPTSRPSSDSGLSFGNTLGRIEVIWATTFGEPGKLQSTPVPRKPPARKEVDLRLVRVPSRIVLESPFSVDVKITNRTERALPLQLHYSKEKMSGLMGDGVSGQFLGEFPPRSSRIVPVPLFPIAPGIQKITGIRVTEVGAARQWDLESAVDVLVE